MDLVVGFGFILGCFVEEGKVVGKICGEFEKYRLRGVVVEDWW
jgi:hypothetical protein